MSRNSLEKTVARLLTQINENGPFAIKSLEGGANNQVFRIDCGDTQYCLKRYFQHENDPRNRFKTEYSFLNFASQHGIQQVPRPFGCDVAEKMALYEFIRGSRFKIGEIHKTELDQALVLFKALNQHKMKPAAQELPPASEYCTKLSDHLARIQYRLERLNSVEAKTTIDRDAIHFIRINLWPVWQEVRIFVQKQADTWQLDLTKEIDQENSCLSPSDFGFHNALKTADGCIYFIDFEYAGWDDPDRMVSDFFCQPAVPVPLDFYAYFTETVAAEYPNPAKHLKRMQLLLPVYQIKWCCILLNDFLPTGSARRQFSKGSENLADKKFLQLEKAKHALERVGRMKSKRLF